MVKSPTKKVNGYYLLFHQFCSIGRSCISIKTNSENYTLPKQQQQYPMALDDTPNTILQSPKLHGTHQLQRPRASLHPKHKIQQNETHSEETKA